MWLWAALVACGTVLVSLYSGPLDVAGASARCSRSTVALTFLRARCCSSPAPGAEIDRFEPTGTL